jgi:galactose mutarotase-like enzyme
VTYEVENTGVGDMPFSIGGHPALNCDLDAGHVKLVFEKEEDLQTLELNLDNGLLKGSRHKVEMEARTLELHPETFDIDTLIFEGLNSQSVRLEDPVTQTRVEVDFKGFPYLGIWSPKAPFVCVEPWCGLADTMGDMGKLEEKLGIEILSGGSVFSCTYTLRVSDLL